MSLRPVVHRELVKEIAAARIEAGMSQWELAACIGCPEQDISKLEVGKRKLREGELVKLCDAMDADALAMLGRSFIAARATRSAAVTGGVDAL